MFNPDNKTPNQSAVPENILQHYSVWLNEENVRVPIPNWTAQAIMGGLFMLVSLLSVEALIAWLHGADWDSNIQTAVRNSQPVMHPIGQLILIGAFFFAGGLTILLTAFFCKQRDND